MKNLNHENGFSLMEMVAGMAVTGLALLTLMVLLGAAFSSQAGSDAGAEANDLADDVRRGFFSEDQCTKNLRGVSLSMAQPAGASLAALNWYDTAGASAGEMVRTGGTRGALTVGSITLKPVAQVGQTQMQAELVVGVKNSLGQALSPRPVGILAQMQGGVVQKCWLREDLATEQGNELCSVLSGGANNEFDPATQSCGLRNAKWFYGDAMSATCPAGTEFPTTPGEHCSLEAPAGFTDVFPSVNFLLRNGHQFTAGRQPYFTEVNSAGDGCNCVYGTDISPEVRSKFRCGVQCVVL